MRDWERVLKMERTHENQEALSKAKRLLKLSKRKNYYKILGVEKSASQDEIRKAYRKEALKHHPGQRNKGFLVSTRWSSWVEVAQYLVLYIPPCYYKIKEAKLMIIKIIIVELHCAINRQFFVL